MLLLSQQQIVVVVGSIKSAPAAVMMTVRAVRAVDDFLTERKGKCGKQRRRRERISRRRIIGRIFDVCGCQKSGKMATGVLKTEGADDQL